MRISPSHTLLASALAVLCALPAGAGTLAGNPTTGLLGTVTCPSTLLTGLPDVTLAVQSASDVQIDALTARAWRGEVTACSATGELEKFRLEFDDVIRIDATHDGTPTTLDLDIDAMDVELASAVAAIDGETWVVDLHVASDGTLHDLLRQGQTHASYTGDLSVDAGVYALDTDGTWIHLCDATAANQESP